MPAHFHINDSSLTVRVFVQYINTYEQFECLDTGQEFVDSWLNNKQFYYQKTSGSTGKPTIHKISRANILASANRTSQALTLNTGIRALVCINMAYIGGKMMLARGMAFDWQLTLLPPRSFSNINDIPEGNFDFAAMVPLQIENLLASEQGRKLLSNIKKIIIGGAATGKHLIDKLQAFSCEVYATYGMTETVSHIALQALNGTNKSAYFKMLDGVEYRTDDRNCLCIKADVTDYQWIQTNDVVDFKAPGQFQILGRADNVINTGGVKIQIEQLEAKITPLLVGIVNDLAVTKKSDDKLGEKVVLICESATITATEIIDQLKITLTRFEVPKEVLFNTIPKTDAGKTDRPATQRLADS